MALPRKRTRVLNVDGVQFRYVGDASRMEGDDYGIIIIEKAENARQKIRAHFTYTKLSLEYRRVGHALSHVIDYMPPYVVRQTILYAREHGWTPDEGGGILDLGNLDDKLDFSKLNPESQYPGNRY